MKTSLIIPAYNEEEAISLVIAEYLPHVDEIIVVDDGSKDDTYNRALTHASPQVKILRHDKNSGKVAALLTGVKNSSHEVIIFTDADCTYPARYIPDFIFELEKGADLVIGTRVIQSQNIPLFNRIGNFVFSLLAGFISGEKITDAQTGFRACTREKFAYLKVNAFSLEFETKMTVRAAKLGYIIAEVPIEYRERVGLSKLHPVKDGFRILQALLSIAWNETSPLSKMIALPGVIFFLAGLMFGAFNIIEYINYHNLSHEYNPLLAGFLIIFGLQFVSMGLLADHLSNKIDRLEERFRKNRS